MLPVLTWQAPAACPDQGSMQARMEAALRRAPESAEGVEVHGRVAPLGAAGWQLQLDLVQAGTAPRRRQLTAPSCDELADAAAVAIVLALGNQQEPAEHASAAAEAPIATAAVVAVAAQGEATRLLEPSLRREHHSSLVLAGAAVVDSGMLPRLGWGGRLDLQARLEAWSAGLYALWLGEQELEPELGQGAGFGLLAAGLRACYRPLRGELALEGCLGLELEWLSAAAHGLAAGRDDHEQFLAPLAGTALSWHAFPNWALFARGDGLVPLSRHRYIVNESQTLHETPGFALRLSLGLEGDLVGH
jgi:hypothetical protein